MPNDILELIHKIDYIESLFHKIGGDVFSEFDVICNVDEFIKWKQELLLELEILHCSTKDNFIHGILVNLKEGFNGWNDKSSFMELKGSLLAVEKNIHKYYKLESKNEMNSQEAITVKNKQTKIFISHSSQDKKHVLDLVNFLEDLGLRQKHLFCSSVPGYGIPLGEDIYEYLKEQFDEYELHIFFVLSEDYYKSAPCMNEMGAAWVLKKEYTTILTPGFTFKDIKGAISPQKIGLRLDGDTNEIKEILGQLKDTIIQEFRLDPIQQTRWENKRDDYIKIMSEI